MTETSPLSDVELVRTVVNESAPQNLRSQAFAELADRHTGLYVKIASQYSGFSDKINLADLKDDKEYNMYQWIIKYDAERNMKVGTFIGEMLKYHCLDILAKTPDQVPIDQVNEPAAPATSLGQGTTEQEIQILEQKAPVSDPDFWRIFRARHSGDKPKTWREIGRDMNMTHEWARQIYYRYIPRIQETIQS